MTGPAERIGRHYYSRMASVAAAAGTVAAVAVVAATRPIGPSIAVVGAFSGPNGVHLAAGAEPVDAALSGRLLSAYRSAGGTGQPDEVIKIPTLGLAEFPLVAVTGLGVDDHGAGDGPAGSIPLVERTRRAVGAALRALPGPARVRVCLAGSADPTGDLGPLEPAIAVGAVLGRHRFAGYKSSARPARSGRIEIASDGGPGASRDVRQAVALARAIAAARDLVNTPPNDLYPQSLAAQLVALADGLPVEVEVLDERGLARQGYRGILAAGRGSARGPRVVRLRYRPARPRARVALVGDGTTFNSGGLSLKTTQMSATKADMAGAAAAALSVLAAAARKLAVEVTATLPLVENLPSGTAYRPSDIVSIRGGRTVEVTDTDASGRIGVAEAIGRAIEDKPDYLIEISSLTVAQRVALGPRIIAAMGEPAFRDRVVAAGRAGGESLWAMPLPAELRAGLDSGVADLAVTAPDRWGAMLVGATFVADFVPADLPWVHLDVTGPAWNSGGAYGYTPKGGTGAGVVTVMGALESIAATG
jgi:leucyl aminopeptidase